MNNIVKAKYIGKKIKLCPVSLHSLVMSYEKNKISIYVNNVKIVYANFLELLKDWSDITMIGHYSINRSNILKK